MRTKDHSLNYSDLCEEVRNDNMVLTPENACHVIFGKGIFACETTVLMRQFRKDCKTYMVISFGTFGSKRVALVAKYEPNRYAPKAAPTMTMVKKMAMEDYLFWGDSIHDMAIQYPKRMEQLIVSVADRLLEAKIPGLYTIKDPVMLKAQLPRDRSGFHKVWNNGFLVAQQNYGDCSMAFSVVGVWVFG